MVKAQLVNLTAVCRSFPDPPQNEVHRNYLLDTIDDMFAGDSTLVVVEGREGIGKSTLLAQYATRHPNHAISLFIKPTSRLAYAPEFIKPSLSEQIHWALTREIVERDAVDESYIREQLVRLQWQAKKRNAPFYFVVDGLSDLPIDAKAIIESILIDLLPVGVEGFRFLLSGELALLSQFFRKPVVAKTFPLAPFSLDEATRYLTGTGLSREHVEDVYRLCSGIPAHLAGVNRMLQSGEQIASILDGTPSKLPDFIAMEWDRVKRQTPTLLDILSVIAYGERLFNTNDIGRILRVESQTVVDLVRNINFLTLNDETEDIDFISEPHRRYAATELRGLREKTHNLLINDLLASSEGVNKLTYLPTYYERADRLDDLLEYLTPDHFIEVLQQSQSLNYIYQRADLGLQAAHRLDRKSELLKFALHRSVLKGVGESQPWRSEVEARMSLKDYESSLALANGGIPKEDRLHLLAVIAKIQKEHGLCPDQALLDQISLVYNQIDIKSLGDRAVEIASDLMWSEPDLAINMVEEASSAGSQARSLDVALADLEIVALKSPSNRSQVKDILQKTSSRIKDPELSGFSSGVSLMFGDYSATEIIARVEKLEIKNRLFFLRQWAITNRETDGAAHIIDYSLDLLIKNSSDTPKMRDLRELAVPLPSVPNLEEAKELVGRFDSQKGSIEEFGTPEDYIRLQLLLARTEGKYEREAACNRVVECYLYIQSLQDLAAKVACTAWVVSSLDDIDPDGEIEAREGIGELSLAGLMSGIQDLLQTSAQHYEVAKGTIRALALSKPDLAFKVALSLNTEDRRDMALLFLILLLLKDSDPDLALIGQILASIGSPSFHDAVVLDIFKHLASKEEPIRPDDFTKASSMIHLVKRIRRSKDRCISYCHVYSFLSRQDSVANKEMMKEVLDQIEQSWEAIDSEWVKVDTAFSIASALTNCSEEAARYYLKLGDELRNNHEIDGENLALAYIQSIRLAIHSFRGLLKSNLNDDNDIRHLELLIGKIPSNGERSRLWSEIAINCFAFGQEGLGRRLVAENVKPLLQTVSDLDQGYKYSAIREIGPALYMAHRTTALELISKLPDWERNQIYDRICEFIFRKYPPFEPYEYLSGDGYKLRYEEAVDICDLIQLMTRDLFMYVNIEILVDSILSKKNKNKFTHQQREDIANRIQILADAKLPDPKGIAHDGYKIVFQAQMARLKQSYPHWDKLIRQAGQIPVMM